MNPKLDIEQLVEKITRLVARQPEKAAKILTHWLAEKAKKKSLKKAA